MIPSLWHPSSPSKEAELSTTGVSNGISSSLLNLHTSSGRCYDWHALDVSATLLAFFCTPWVFAFFCIAWLCWSPSSRDVRITSPLPPGKPHPTPIRLHWRTLAKVTLHFSRYNTHKKLTTVFYLSFLGGGGGGGGGAGVIIIIMFSELLPEHPDHRFQQCYWLVKVYFNKLDNRQKLADQSTWHMEGKAAATLQAVSGAVAVL